MYRDETKNLMELMNLKDYSIIWHLGEINNPEYSVSSSNIRFTFNITSGVNSILYLCSISLSNSMISGLSTSQTYYFRFNQTHKINSINYNAYPIWADNTNLRGNTENPYIPRIDNQSVIYTGYSNLSASSAGLSGLNIVLLFIPISYSSFFG